MSPLLLLSLLLSASSPYCQGWGEGWKKGWCYDQLHCAPPVPPACPVPVAGKNTLEDGRADGFVQGREKAARMRGKDGVRRP